MKLTEYQKEYILDTFFKDDHYAGWKNIATDLIEIGSCIVAGETCIWNGGIGNFIKTTVDKNSFGCLRYEFDLKSFISSAFFQGTRNSDVAKLQNKIDQIQEQCFELKSLNANL